MRKPSAPNLPDTAAAPLAPAKRRSPGRRPLPDAVAVRAVQVPQTGPPYDDAGALARRAGRAAAARPGASAYPPSRPAAKPAARNPAARKPPGLKPVAKNPAVLVPGGLNPAGLNPGVTTRCGKRPSQTGQWPSQFAQVLAETLAGSRPPNQITPWTTDQAMKRISQLGPILATAHQPRVKRVILRSPADGVLEMAVIVGLGERVRALAIRLEHSRHCEEPAPGFGDPGGRPPGVLPPPPQPATPQAAASPAAEPWARWRCTAIEAA
ncbi:MAG TPA: Rv3235 family protein [Streptosporangiaceae bacterium]|nr:Rv3235 family protein [Streptosporangiaceae bacterium]